MTYAQAIDWLYGRQRAGIKLGLGNIRKLLATLELPPDELRIVHVAGTNGKGSTCAFADSILRQAGYRSGLFTSPHLISFRERIRINGEPIGEAAVTAGLESLRQLIADWEEKPTFFELATALALQHFADEHADVALLEVGLGGRLDSTNSISPAVCAIAPIALDHCHILGEDLATIAAEKAGIIKPGVPVVSAPQAPEAAAVLTARASELGAPLEFIGQAWEGEIALQGEHQRWNAALALAALRAGGFTLGENDAARGITGTRWRARFERLRLPSGTELVVDGAHNVSGAAALAATWRQAFGATKATIILSASANKDTPSLIEALAEIAGSFICTEPDTLRRTASPEELLALIPTQFPAESAADVATALDIAARRGAPVLATGSLFLAGEVLSIVGDRHEEYEASDQ